MYQLFSQKDYRTMIPSSRSTRNPAEYQSVPDDPADWASMMQQWIKIRDTVTNNHRKSDSSIRPQILVPIKTEVSEQPSSPQILKPVKSEVFELPAPQTLEPVKLEVSELPTPQILKPVKLEVIEFPESLQSLEPIKSEMVEAPSLNGTILGEGPINKVAGGNCANTLEKVKMPSKVREKSNKKKKKKHKKLKSERLTELKSDVVLSNDVQGDNVCNKRKKSRFSSPSAQHSRLINPPSTKKNLNDASKTKNKSMDKTMLKVRQILLELLMETTENQVSIIAKEEFRRAKSIAQSIKKKFSVLSSLSGKLGLKIYDSNDSDNSERQRHEKNQMESDEELKILIDRRQRNFEKIEMQIDLELESRKEKEKSIAYQDGMKEKCVQKNDSKKNNVEGNRLLKSTHEGTNDVKSKITNKVVPKSRDLTVGPSNKSEMQNHQTQSQQKSGTQPTIRKRVNENLKKIEPTREYLSSSSSTLSPSSLSSTTSWSSGSKRSCSSSSSRSDSKSDSDRNTRRKSTHRANGRSSFSKKHYPRHYRSPSPEYRRVPLRRRSPNRETPRSRYTSPYRRRVSPNRYLNSSSTSRSVRQQSQREHSERRSYRSNSRETRRK